MYHDDCKGIGVVTEPAKPQYENKLHFSNDKISTWTLMDASFLLRNDNNIGSHYNTSTKKFVITNTRTGVYYVYGQWFGSVMF